MTIVELVMTRLNIRTKAELSRLLGVCRQSPAEWISRLGGGIPTRHWPKLIDEAKRRGARLTYEELRSERQ